MSTTFKLTSIDHDAVLLDSEIHSTRHLLGSGQVVIPPKQIKLEFTVDGERFENILNREAGAVKAGARVTLGLEDGKTEVIEAPETFAFYSEDRKWVMTFHNHEKIDGIIVTEENKLHHFQATEGEFKINQNMKDIFSSSEVEQTKDNLRKLTEEDEGRRLNVDYWEDCHTAQSSGLSGVDVGMAIGSNFYFSFGSDQSMQLANSYIVNSNTIYETQMDISLKIAEFFIATTDSAASWTSPNCRVGIQSQLSSFRFWNKPTTLPLWHLMDDCFGFSGSILGIAYIAGLCESNTNVGVSYYSESFNARDYPTWGTVAHEIGHNFNAQHSFEEGQGNTGGIMDYGPMDSKLIDGVQQFNTKYRQREVCSEVANSIRRGCVDVGQGLEAEEETIITEIARSTFVSTDCTKKVHRAPVSNNHLFVARSGYTLAQCDAVCDANSSCDSFVYGDASGHCELFSGLSQDDVAFTPAFDTYLCGEAASRGIVSETLDDFLAKADLAEIQESCCTMEDNMHVQGLNRWLESGVTKEQCFSTCVSNSGCEAASWDIADNTCLYFGGADYSDELFSLNGAYTMQCRNTCIQSRANGGDGTTLGSSLGVFFGVGVAVAAIGGLYRLASQKKAAPKNEVCASN